MSLAIRGGDGDVKLKLFEELTKDERAESLYQLVMRNRQAELRDKRERRVPLTREEAEAYDVARANWKAFKADLKSQDKGSVTGWLSGRSAEIKELQDELVEIRLTRDALSALQVVAKAAKTGEKLSKEDAKSLRAYLKQRQTELSLSSGSTTEETYNAVASYYKSLRKVGVVQRELNELKKEVQVVFDKLGGRVEKAAVLPPRLEENIEKRVRAESVAVKKLTQDELPGQGVVPESVAELKSELLRLGRVLRDGLYRHATLRVPQNARIGNSEVFVRLKIPFFVTPQFMGMSFVRDDDPDYTYVGYGLSDILKTWTTHDKGKRLKAVVLAAVRDHVLKEGTRREVTVKVTEDDLKAIFKDSNKLEDILPVDVFLPDPDDSGTDMEFKASLDRAALPRLVAAYVVLWTLTRTEPFMQPFKTPSEMAVAYEGFFADKVEEYEKGDAGARADLARLHLAVQAGVTPRFVECMRGGKGYLSEAAEQYLDSADPLDMDEIEKQVSRAVERLTTQRVYVSPLVDDTQDLSKTARKRLKAREETFKSSEGCRGLRKLTGVSDDMRLAKKTFLLNYHPDKVGNTEENNQRFKELYKLLEECEKAVKSKG